MAYLTCPWCLSPQLIADESPEYKCYTCAAEVRAATARVEGTRKPWPPL